MNEERFQIKPEGVRYICEFCNEGEMKFAPERQEDNGPLYTHVCTKCNKEMLLQKVYPYIDWIPVEGDSQ